MDVGGPTLQISVCVCTVPCTKERYKILMDYWMTPVAIMDSWIIVWHLQVTMTTIHLGQGCIISHSDIHFLYLWILCWSNYDGFIDSWITPPNDIDNYPLRWRLQKREGTMLHYYLTFPHSHYLTTHSDKGILVAEGPFHKVLERCQICKKKVGLPPAPYYFWFSKVFITPSCGVSIHMRSDATCQDACL